jgi:transposase
VLRQQHGYRGSYATLARYLQRLHAAQGELGAHPPAKRSRGVLSAAPQRVLTPRTAAWLVLRRMEKRSEEDHALLADLRSRAPELDEAVALAEAFTGLIRDHAPERRDLWLQQAGDSMVRQLQSFAKPNFNTKIYIHVSFQSLRNRTAFLSTTSLRLVGKTIQQRA